jgi:hypothetical protein
MSYDQPPPPSGGQPYGAPQYGGPPAQDPGRTMGIVGLVLSVIGLFCGISAIAGIIVSAIAMNKSKTAGFKNNLALAGLIIGVVSLVLGVIISITYTLPMMQQMS